MKIPSTVIFVGVGMAVMIGTVAVMDSIYGHEDTTEREKTKIERERIRAKAKKKVDDFVRKYER